MNYKAVLRHAVTALLSAGTVLGVNHFRHPLKHTGPATVAMVSPSGREAWFIRANNQVFYMAFDQEVSALGPGPKGPLRFDDITYTDDTRDVRHLVSVTLPTK